MKDYLLQQVRGAPTPAHARNTLREYLQARMLGSLQRAGAMVPLAFHGGTALRFLYAMPRYSEDLDFTLERRDRSYDLQSYVKAIKAEMTMEGYAVTLKVSDRKTVQGAFVRFPTLLHELGLSPHRDEAITVKIEVDTNPPAGAGLATTVVRRHITLRLHHHDRASLLAGKIHSVLCRAYTKGRDIYDLFWYLASPDWPEPNLVQLTNAMLQTGWQGGPVTADNWRALLLDKLDSLVWKKVVDDVGPFLEPPADSAILTLDNLASLLKRNAGA